MTIFFCFHKVIIKNSGNVTFPSKKMCQNFQVIYSVAYPTPSWILWAFHWFVRSFRMSILLRRWFIQLFKVCGISVTLLTIGRHHFQLGMTKKPFVHPLWDSLTPADLRLRPLLGAFRTSGAVPRDFLATHVSFSSWFLNPRRRASGAPISGISHLWCGPFGVFTHPHSLVHLSGRMSR